MRQPLVKEVSNKSKKLKNSETRTSPLEMDFIENMKLFEYKVQVLQTKMLFCSVSQAFFVARKFLTVRAIESRDLENPQLFFIPFPFLK